MSKKKAPDPGIEYLRNIGFNRIKGKYGLQDRLISVFGNEKTDDIFRQRYEIGDGTPEFYELKNSDPEISKAFSESYDWDIIKSACNYIASNKEYFGNTILEVGCDIGYMTGFLAQTFPTANIVAIDRCENAVKIASERIASMKIDNVEFRVCALEDVSDRFDTVFCMRTFQENFDKNILPFTGESLLQLITDYIRISHPYTSQLKSCLAETGTLVVFERLMHDPLMCGWMVDLCRSECAPILNTHKEILCAEGTNSNTFQAFVCKNGTSCEYLDVINHWAQTMCNNKLKHVSLTGWNALLYLAKNAGTLVRGAKIYDREQLIGRLAIFRDKDNNSQIYYLQAPGKKVEEIATLSSMSSDNLEAVLSDLYNKIKEVPSFGWHIDYYSENDPFVEGNGRWTESFNTDNIDKML